MSDWAVIFLGVIAVATLATAAVQVAVLVAAARLTRRLERAVDDLQRELKPIFVHLDALGRDATRASSLATAQVERADQVFADLAVRLDRTLATLQNAASGSAREGAALLAAFRAALAAVRDRTGRARTPADEEDALFI